jgi:hypothetical protein
MPLVFVVLLDIESVKIINSTLSGHVRTFYGKFIFEARCDALSFDTSIIYNYSLKKARIGNGLYPR